MSSRCRTILLSVMVLALAAAVPAFAGQAPAQAPALQAPAGCAPAADLFAVQDQALVCQATPVSGEPAQPEFMTTPTTHPYTGYCRCGCRFVKDCNTDADCNGGRCLSGVSCC
ncbi:MAG TPA: hypothetical protein VF173_33635 [Thermoanaerobaculia bacterium]|nr:hypothetical protein [Thermoanaerobaculia bacterium]